MNWARLPVLAIVLLIGGVSGLQWSGSDSGPIQVCSGHSIQLLWNFTLDRGERVKYMEWRYQVEGGSEDTMATCVDGHFLPTPSFSGRVAQHKDGGIELSCATILESGNYSIPVSVEHRDSSQTLHSKTATVNVVDTPKTQSGEIHVTIKAEAVRDVTTGEWNIHLACGNFTDRGHPPVHVVWTTPRGEQLESSGYEDGAFLLALANPVLAGSYSCRIAPTLPAAHCLPPHSPLRNTEGVQVDATAARLAVMEAQQREMMDTMAQMMDTMAAERREMNNTIAEMDNTMAEMNNTMAEMNNTMAAERREMNNTMAEMNSTMAEMNSTMAEMNNTMAEMNSTMAEMNNTMAEMNSTMAEMNSTMAEMNNTMAEMNSTMAEMNNTMAEMDNTMAEMNNTMAEMNNTMAEMNSTMAEMNNTMAEMNSTMAEMNNTMAEMDNTMAEMNNTMAEMNNTMAEMDNTMAEMDNTMAEMNNTMAEMNNTMAEMDNTMAEMDNTMAEMDNTMAEMNNTMAEMDNTMAEMDNTMAEMDNTMAEMNNTMAEMDNTMAEMNNTMAEMDNTMAEMDNTMAEMDNTMAEMNNTMAEMNNTMAAERREMDNRTSKVEAAIDDIHQHSVPVSFYARLGSNIRLSFRSTVKLNRVTTNQGGGYNSTSGQFTAPVSGTYFFIGTAAPYGSGERASMRLMKEGVSITYIWLRQYDSYYTMASCHGVVHMEAGERVWLESSAMNYFSSSRTSFSGFQID